MAIRHPQAIQRLSGSPATAESRPGTIGRISLASRSKQESAVREIRMLRSTRRGLETWHGRDAVTLATERARQQGTQTSTYTGAPVPDPTCVQRRLACSAGDRPAGARVRSPVV